MRYGQIKIEDHPKVITFLNVTLGKTHILYFDITKQKDLSNVVLNVPPIVGDMAPDIVLHDYKADKDVKLSDFKGQVVYLGLLGNLVRSVPETDGEK